MNRKKFLIALFAILGVSCCLLFFPQHVFASSGDIGDGVWLLPESSDSPASTINVDATAKSTPDWLQQLSEGVVIHQAEKICYPFRGGQFHWVPQIMQSVDNGWLPILTTQEYLDGTEGSPFACATTNIGGTFALFGYYDGPIEQIIIETPEETEEDPPPLECPPNFIPAGNVCVPVPNK